MKHSQRLKGIVKALSIKRLGHYRGSGVDSGDVLDNDDQSSIDNAVSLAGPSTTMISSSSTDTAASAEETKPKDVVTLSPGYPSKDKAMGLLDLPQELFDSITSYLGHAHIAVLALVNKELMARFQPLADRVEIMIDE